MCTPGWRVVILHVNEGYLPHLSRLPHLPGVSHLHVNRPLVSLICGLPIFMYWGGNHFLLLVQIGVLESCVNN